MPAAVRSPSPEASLAKSPTRCKGERSVSSCTGENSGRRGKGGRGVAHVLRGQGLGCATLVMLGIARRGSGATCSVRVGASRAGRRWRRMRPACRTLVLLTQISHDVLHLLLQHSNLLQGVVPLALCLLFDKDRAAQSVLHFGAKHTVTFLPNAQNFNLFTGCPGCASHAAGCRIAVQSKRRV